MSIIFKRPILNLDKAPTILWDNIFTKGTLNYTSGQGPNLVDYATNDYWTPTSLPAEISVTLSSSIGAGYLGVCSHNMGSVGSTLELQRHNGSSFVTVFTHSPEDDSVFFIPFNYAESDRWKIRITGSSAPSIGVAFLGTSLQFDCGIIPGYVPLYMGEDIELLTAQTITGQFMPNRIQRRGLSTSFNLNILDREFVEGESFQAFRRYYNDGGSFFFAGNPDELRDDVSYCWRQEGATLQPSLTGLFYETGMALEGFLD